MCTLTIFYSETDTTRFRVGFSRDELRRRPIALPPQVYTAGNSEAIYPLDPQGKGTWLAVNNHGFVLALLNRNRLAGDWKEYYFQERPWRSRGTVIPQLVTLDDMEKIRLTVQNLPLDNYMPFRLIVIHREGLMHIQHDSEGLQVQRSNLKENTPLLYASSGLGDGLAEEYRKIKLSEYLKLKSHEPPEVIQDQFHMQRETERPHLSVCMERHDAHTVSYSWLEVTEKSAHFSYTDGAPCERKKAVVAPQLSLPIL